MIVSNEISTFVTIRKIRKLSVFSFICLYAMKSAMAIPPERKPVVAGRFYPASADELYKEIDNLYHSAIKLNPDFDGGKADILALVSPHAGYVFSGAVAASAFGFLRNSRKIHRVFLLGSSHYAWYEGASIYFKGHYSTPLGKIEIDNEIATRLMDEDPVFSFHPEAHSQEHSLEVQLPFLQFFLNTDFKIIPILLGGQSIETPKKIAGILSRYLGGENLFVISTDLSHYPEYNDAVKVDKNTVEAFCSNDPEIFLDQLKINEQKKYPNLSTSMCGWMAALTLLYMTHHRKGITYTPILYQNSGEIPLYGDKSRVVGYQSLAVFQNAGSDEDSISFNEEDKHHLLSLARNSIINKLKGKKTGDEKPDDIPEKYVKPQGAFVSIYVNHELRGCIGKIESNSPLYETIEQTAISAALHDTRFPPVKPEELEAMEIEISILTPLKKIQSVDEIVPGKHGILIRKDIRSGTFLPQVAARTGWSAQEMLEECSERKAGLGRDGWRDADIYIYEALIISEVQ